MAEKENAGECQHIRAMFDEAAAMQEDFVSLHLVDCLECKHWASVTQEIISVSANLPAFDVPEAVTQSILSKVTQARKEENKAKDWMIPALVVVALICLWSLVGAETPEGLCSWVICGGILLALKTLADSISDPRTLGVNLHK